MYDKKNRRFRTMQEIQDEYNEQEHNFKDEIKDIAQNFKAQIFSPWGMLVMLAMISGILSAVVR